MTPTLYIRKRSYSILLNKRGMTVRYFTFLYVWSLQEITNQNAVNCSYALLQILNCEANNGWLLYAWQAAIERAPLAQRARKSTLPPGRIELPTPGLQDQCSNHWAMEAMGICQYLYFHVFHFLMFIFLIFWIGL